jgi:hypothetical protein
MEIIKVNHASGESSFNLVGLTEEQVRMLAGVADFPVWDAQPAPVATFLEELHEAACSAPDVGFEDIVTAIDLDMAPRTTTAFS